MKSAQIIADVLSSWRTFEDAGNRAHEAFAQLDPDEIERLALRAFTEEFRATLRRKDSRGVPLYGNVEKTDPGSGRTVRRYKQTALFTEDDYRSAIASCQRRAKAETHTARALIADCAARLDVQLRLDGRDASAPAKAAS